MFLHKLLKPYSASSLRLVFSLSTLDPLSPSLLIIFYTSITYSQPQTVKGVWGQSPPVLAFSLRVWGLVSLEYHV